MGGDLQNRYLLKPNTIAQKYLGLNNLFIKYDSP
jgi:hypothetical protein